MRRPFQAAPNVISREVGGEVVLLNLDTGTYFSLNSTGTKYWTLASEGLAHDAIVERIADGFKVSRDVVASDLDELVESLTTAGLIVAG